MNCPSHIRTFFTRFHWPVIAILILLLSVLSCGGKQEAPFLKIGVPEKPKTLNIWLTSDTHSKKILSLIYQPLYLRDPDTLALIPWLADSLPQFEAKTISYTLRLKPAKWSDGSEVTSADVAFTAAMIKEFRVPRYFSKWKFVKKIETPDKNTVRFYLEEPKAIFLTRTLTTPVVQKKEWLQVVQRAREQQKPLQTLLNYKIEHPVGCGPFVLKEWHRGSYLRLGKNKYFFGRNQVIGKQRLGPFVDDIIIKIFGTSDVAILALKKGDIDMFWWGVQPGYLEDIAQSKDIQLFFNEKSGLYFMGFNVRTPPFTDTSLRQAIAVLIDKDFIISRVLQGYATRMDSIIPPGNQYWFFPDIPRYGKGMNRKDRVQKAYQMLKKAGYTWDQPPVDENGNVVAGKGIRLPGGQLMEKFTILTPPADYDPHRSMSGMMIQEWLRAVGLPAFCRPMAFAALLDQVKARHEFDAFILGYGKLSLDPDYLRNFFHSANDKRRGWNMSGYKNPGFDRIGEKSAREMNKEQRKRLIWAMQKIIMADVPYIPIYNPKIIEAVRTDKFSGWVQTLGGIGNIWSLCQVKLKGPGKPSGS